MKYNKSIPIVRERLAYITMYNITEEVLDDMEIKAPGVSVMLSNPR